VTSLQLAYGTNAPKIPGIPELPSALPFIGHLHLHAGASGLGNDAALWTYWSNKLGSDILQVKWGNRRVVTASSFHSIKEIIVTNGTSTNGRPRAHIFEKYVGYDLGSYSLEPHSRDGNFKAQRTAAIKSANPRNFPSFYPCLQRAGDRVVANLAVQGGYGKTAINPLSYMQVVAMAVRGL
jgi:phenylacetate 2-hydroxylase